VSYVTRVPALTLTTTVADIVETRRERNVDARSTGMLRALVQQDRLLRQK
jgi:hypothetical protein